jgi:hypothetical protein
MTRSIAILTPIGVETGGPEALHQLCHSLRKFGADAFLVPMKGTETASPVETYQSYNAPVRENYSSEDLLVVPEITPEISLSAKKSIIWWLSVDNSPLFLSMFNMASNQSLEFDVERIKNHLKSGSVKHFAQSFHAKNFLKQNFHLESKMLTDYISMDFVKKSGRTVKESVTCSFKGENFYREIQLQLPSVEIERIAGLNRREVLEKLNRSRLFIDFGNQPGRDRMPREAALAGSYVILNKRGAAANLNDAPLPKSAKISDSDLDYSVSIIRKWLNRSPYPSPSQIFYRKWVEGQEKKFNQEVKKLFELTKD